MSSYAERARQFLHHTRVDESSGADATCEKSEISEISPYGGTGRCAGCGERPEYMRLLSPAYEVFCAACIPPGPRRTLQRDERCNRCWAVVAYFTPDGEPLCVAHRHVAEGML
jgi:hypothetical protein